MFLLIFKTLLFYEYNGRTRERMDSERWAKICWEEIKRGVKNEMATEWGREMVRRLAGLGRDWRECGGGERGGGYDKE